MKIYEEGEATWGLKSGFLDADDVKRAIQKLKEDMALLDDEDDSEWVRNRIDKIFGAELT